MAYLFIAVRLVYTEKYVEIYLYTYEKYKSRMNVYLQMHLNTSLINFYPQISNLQETF